MSDELATRPNLPTSIDVPLLSSELIGPREMPLVLDAFLNSPAVGPCITTHRTTPARGADTAPFPDWMRPELIEVLGRRGVSSLYSHQREALDAVHDGDDIVVVTPTASGKSLCYHLPVLQKVLEDPDARALYIFPTKALSQDQYMTVHGYIDDMDADIRTFTFDGDTPADARQAVRSHGHIVVSNPDMIHTGILPHHTKWVKLFRNLKYVVIDELHTYRGVFGSHVANVIRRLKRIAAFHGARPQFICCSATIANPAEHAAQLIERPVRAVERNGAPEGERHLLFYNPPVVNKQLGIRASYLHAARRFAISLIERDIPTIVFAPSRLNVEVLLRYLREDLAHRNIDPDRVQGYRGGYLPNLRRSIERGLRSGDITGVVATNALELGIDIGHLSACVVAGYPGSVASLWQQSGRAGRRAEAALTIFVARSSPVDQYIAQHPDYFFAQSPESARIQPDNLFVAVDHVRCAAFELPFEDGERFGSLPADEVDAVLDHLAAHRVVNRSGGRSHWMSESYPAGEVSLRRVHSENFVVIDTTRDKIIAEVDFDSVQTTLHTHAIYTVDGRPHEVVQLDYDNNKAYVRPVEPDYFTDAMTYAKVEVLDVERSAPPAEVLVEHGEVSVTRKVVGFKKIKLYTHENVGYGDVVLPELTLHTSAWWFTVPRALLAELPYQPADLVDALVGIGHALQYVCSMAVMCDPRDLGRCVGDKSAEAYAGLPAPGDARSPQRHAIQGALGAGADPFQAFDPTVFIYESLPGGVGMSPKLFDNHRLLLERTRALLAACPCESGCPSCIGPMPEDLPHAKQAPIDLLDRVLQGLAG